MYCIVVKLGAFQSYDLLHHAFGQKLPVIWDRRRVERRRTMRPLDVPNRRRVSRRGPPTVSWTALGFVVVER
jgi:hypothetical protein